jgi:S-DNA-T family DNA segregation ATPase FtsK/SpoIIIE
LAKRKAAAKASVTKTGMSEVLGHRLREGAFIGFAVVCIYVFIALSSYNGNDPGWSTTGSGHSIRNAGGITGAYISDIFYTLFGYMAFLFPILLGYRAWLIFRERQNPENFDWFHFAVRVGGFCLVMISATGLSQINVGDSTMLPEGAGGILGVVIGDSSLNAFSIAGARLLLLALFLFGVTIFTGLSWLKLMDDTGRMTITLWQWLQLQVSTLRGKWRDMLVRRKARKKRQNSFEQQIKKVEKRKQPKIEPVKKPVEQGKRVFKEKQVNLFKPSGNGELPQLSLLDTPSASDKKGYSEEALRSLSQRLEHKLDDFGITAEVKAVFPGPVITRFEIDPAPGIKVSRISNLAKDLARSLSVISVRVVEVIPGKSFVGIEIPNEDREMVYLSQVLSSKTFDDARSPVSLALGHDIAGLPIIADLSKMPHLLVAGTTGSGKSVGVNAMLLSLLYKASPDEVRLIMVDPKMLELSIYDGIPHLLTPVITDMKDAASGLRWCVGEMERRYKQMAALGVRNLQGYNRKVNDAIASGNPIPDPLWQFDPNAASIGVPEVTEAPTLGPLPFIVVVIDEFADMMMIVGKKVEELIARIAQKARAAGIHLILATQRPSVDVITGLIKANIPTRIAFQVSSKIDSRTILDQGGAEQLLGHGDMLYLPPGTGLPVRVHGAFVDDHEVHKVVEDWKQRAQPNYIEDLLEDGANEFVPGYSNPAGGGGGDEDPEADALYDEAVHFVTQSRKASISSVQRKLRIGYNRAARMIETMEETGVVSPMGTNGQREVLAPSPPGD